MRRALLTLTCVLLAAGVSAAEGQPWTCGLDNIGNTLTLCKSNDEPLKRLYITDIVAQSTTTTVGQMLIRYGTGSACGTGTTSILPSAATAVRLAYPPSTAAPLHLRFVTPVIVPAAQDLCVLGIATQTLTIQINGYLAP